MTKNTISVRSKRFSIPSYSLTGDLLAFRKCKLQYRFNNKGALPPSVPVQQWFGEFIHGVMEESFLIWKQEMKLNGSSEFPWSFEKIQEISVEVAKRLKSKGLKPYGNIFCDEIKKSRDKKRCPDNNHPHHLLANERAFKAVNLWGRYLFPLIEEPEITLQGLRPMPEYNPEISRSNWYIIKGIADVISSINIEKCNPSNKLVSFLKENKEINEMIKINPEFEVIIDYKGTMIPENSDELEQYDWQISTYMWLQEQSLKKSGSNKPIIAGVLLFLNELYPSMEDCKAISEIQPSILKEIYGATDTDIEMLKKGKGSNLSDNFVLRRSIRIIPYDKNHIEKSLFEFDKVVVDIEKCVQNEMNKPKDVLSCWACNGYDKKRCTACDMKTFCKSTDGIYKPKVP